MDSKTKLTIELLDNTVCLRFNGEALFGFEEVTLEARSSLVPRVKVTLLNTRDVAPAARKERKRLNNRNRALLLQVPFVEVFEAGSIPGVPDFAGEDEPTQA